MLSIDPHHAYDHTVAARPTLTALPHEAETVAIGDAIADLAARIHAATYELLVLIREFDTRAGWNNGFLSCAHWLNWRTGIDLGAAREKVRVAHALRTLPRLSAAMARGQLSYSKVRAVTRVATPDNEARLLDVARCATAAQVERLVRAWRRVDRVREAQETEHRQRSRAVHTWVDGDGMLVIRGRLTPEVGAVVQRALEAAADRLFQESVRTPAATTLTEEVTYAQRRADALALLAESALAADLDRGIAGDRYQVVLHVDSAALRREPDPGGDQGQAALEDGYHLSAETSQRLACDAGVVVLAHGADGSVLDVGRKTRTIPAAIRRALTARDVRCRFPGCSARHCDAHHVRHWAEGGATCLDNLVLLCRRHHRLVHEQGWTVTMRADGVAGFIRPDGSSLTPAPPPPTGWTDDTALAPINARLAAARIAIGPYTATPVGYDDRLDVAWAIDVLRDREFRRLSFAETSLTAVHSRNP